jgi:hypothetical protein
VIERVQLGVRMEKRLVKVLKGLAEAAIADLKRVYDLDYYMHGTREFADPDAATS